METLIIVGYLSALFIGIALGLIGGGGSILTVPVLVYMLGVDAISATALSLFIVGTTSLVGSIRARISHNIEVKTGIIFAIPSLIAVWIMRALVIPSIPKELGSIGDYPVSKEMAVLLFFALIMILSSVSMIKSAKKTNESHHKHTKWDYLLIVVEGLVVGSVTGLVGAGGGFLIIPALVLLVNMPMKKAVGTSLMIIAIKSLIGFTGDLTNPEIVINWNMLVIFTSLSIVGIFIGSALTSYVSGAQLKKGFGWFLLLMGIYMIAERLYHM